MATRFELVLPQGAPGLSLPGLRAAGELALAEIVAAEDLLSTYRVTAQLAQVNARAAWSRCGWLRCSLSCCDRFARGRGARGGHLIPRWGPWCGCGGRFHQPIPSGPSGSPRLARVRVGGRSNEPGELDDPFHSPGVRLDLGSVGRGMGVGPGVGAPAGSGRDPSVVAWWDQFRGGLGVAAQCPGLARSIGNRSVGGGMQLGTSLPRLAV